jgi:hypothetical protein
LLPRSTIADLDADALADTIAKYVWVTPYGVPISAAYAAAISESRRASHDAGPAIGAFNGGARSVLRGISKIRRHETGDAQHFPRMPTRRSRAVVHGCKMFLSRHSTPAQQ